MFVGGIEGGATHSKLLIFSETGDVVASVQGPGTNHWQVGIPECASRISAMVKQGKALASIPESSQLKALGLSLSGCEQEATNAELEGELRKYHGSTAESYVVCSDTIGSIYSATNVGGIVLIAGTGSNAYLRNPSGSSANCGGWGHILGDEGAAWWISHRAIKTIFDHEDGLAKSPYCTDKAWATVKEHFGIETRLDLLDHCYAKFSKAFFAGLCKKLGKLALDGDELSAKLFQDSGVALAQHVQALLPKVEEELVKDGSLSIVCVGSVWESWKFLKPGFVKVLSSIAIPYEIKLLRLTKPMAYGAAYLAADCVNFNLQRNYSDNIDIFFTYTPSLR